MSDLIGDNSNGRKIHFLHVRSEAKKKIPLILTHGWPSSILEYLKIIPLLSTGGECGFDLIIPSLPGYGFSSPDKKKGLSIYKVAELWHALMKELGYSKYAVHGGDWGAYCSSKIAQLYPDSVLGMHLSYLVGGIFPYLGEGSKPLSRAEKKTIEKRQLWDKYEGGYEHIHCTKPQTIAYALTDSPVGLAAWIIEKWRSWTDCDGQPETLFTKDELLANISWYWLTRTGGTSVRLYYETFNDHWEFGRDEKIVVPTAIASFPKELVVSPREWGERLYNIVRWTEMPSGGHFAAAEKPELLAQDLRGFFFETLNAHSGGFGG